VRREWKTGACVLNKFLSETVWCVDGVESASAFTMTGSAGERKTMVSRYLSGFNFEELFGALQDGADGVDFVCISMCDGAQTYNIHHTHAVHLQYPCGVHTCAMRLDRGTLDEQGRVDVAHGCPVEAGKETSMQTRPSGLCRGWST